MRNSPRRFFPFLNRSHATRNLAAECAQVELILMAAFDGEADESALPNARRHLKNCADCARRWEEWEKTRVLLRAVPAPSAPSPLLTRVLLSCRLLSATPSAVLQNQLAQERNDELRSTLTAYLESPEEEFLTTPLANFIAAPAVPPQLKEEILQLTTRAQNAPVASSGVLLVLQKAARETLSALKNPASTLRPARWGVGIAVPAMAVWLIFAGQTEYSALLPATSETPQTVEESSSEREAEVAAPAKSAASVSAQPLPGKWLQPLKGALKSAANSLPVTASAIAKRATETPVSTSPAESQTPPRSVKVAPISPESTPLPVAASARPIPATVAARPAPRGAKPRALPVVNMVENTPSAFRQTAATNLNRRPGDSIARLPRLAESKISVPEVSSPVRLARLSDFDFEEAVTLVTLERDHRPADLGQALDEYRAALLAEHLEDDEDLGDL